MKENKEKEIAASTNETAGAKETPCLTCGENGRLTQDKINQVIEDRRKAINGGQKINK
jgi:hypothetical protein